jgi:hypothetical protein
MIRSFSLAETWRAICVLLLLAATAVLVVMMLMRYVFPSQASVTGWCCMRQGDSCMGEYDVDKCIGEGGYAFAMNESTCMLTCESSPSYDAPQAD